MLTIPLKFVHVGFGNILNVSRAVCIIRARSNPGSRYLKAAKKSGTYLDMCAGRSLRTLVILDDGQVVGCAIGSKALFGRFMQDRYEIAEHELKPTKKDPLVGINPDLEDEEGSEENAGVEISSDEETKSDVESDENEDEEGEEEA